MEPLAAQLAIALDHHKAGRLSAAAGLYQQIIFADPDHSDAWHLMGVLANQTGKAAAATECIARAIELSGPHPALHFNMACALAAAGNLDEAIEHYRQAIALRPDFTEAFINLGAAWSNKGDLAAAVQCYQAALAVEPGRGDALLNLAGVLERLARHDEALTHYRQVIAREPDHGKALIKLASLQQRIGQDEEAIATLQAAIRAEPERHELHRQIGDAYAGRGELEKASAHLQQARRLQPNNLLAAIHAEALSRHVYTSREEIQDVRRALLDYVRGIDPRRFQLDVNDLPLSGAKPPVDLIYHGECDRELKTAFGELFGALIPPCKLPMSNGAPRLGFVVTPGNEGVFLRGMAGVIQHLTPGRFQTIIVSGAAALPALKARLADAAVEYLPLSGPMSQMVEQIRSTAFDLLYFWEIGSDCLNYFLPYFRLARAQCTSWGWPTTSGIPTVDYFVSSSKLEPDGGQSHYTERLVCLDHLPNYYYPPTLMAERPDRSRWGFHAADRLYVCAQNPRKLHPDFDALIAGVLRGDRHGRVVLLEASRPHVTHALRKRMNRAMPDVSNRVQFLPRMTKQEYVNLLSAADVALDTIHYCGGANSNYDTFSAETPVVTAPGEFHRGRYTAAAYEVMGMREYIAADSADYVQRAIRIANDRELRARLSAEISERAPTLFSNVAAVRELEEFFAAAIEQARRAGPV